MNVRRALLDCGLARLDAEVLLAHALEWRRSRLYAYPEYELTTDEQRRFDGLLRQRSDGVPVAYLTGTREFWSLALKVNQHVLIPRPETELLVELALAYLDGKSHPSVADLGTGSGAIAIAIASERPDARIVACERSPESARAAYHNAAAHRLHNALVIQGDWCDALADDRFDLIVSNPPYIRVNDSHLTQGDVAFEPRSALIAGEDGLDDLRAIAEHAPGRLRSGGMLVVEHGFDHSDAVAALFRQAGAISVEPVTDAAGIPRCVSGVWSRDTQAMDR